MSTNQEIEDEVIGILAEHLNADAETSRQELVAGGPEMPIDSLILVEIMARVEARFDVRVPETTAAAAAFSSVLSFVQLIKSLVDENVTVGG